MRPSPLSIVLVLGACTAEPVDPTDTDTGTLPPPDGPPNILLVMLDDMGQDAIAAYGVGPAPPRTPTLDRLVDEGVRFTRAYTYPVCSPSRAAWLTGKYVRRLGFALGGRIDGDERTVAHLAQETGYETALIGKWHLSGLNPQEATDPLRHGFDHFVGLVGNFPDTVGDWGGPLNYFRWELNRNGELSLSTDYAPSVVIDEAIDWITTREGPWLAHVALSSAHGPMHVPPDDLHTTDVTPDSPAHELFRAVAEAGDTELGRLFDAIPPRVLANTVVFVAGDNGTDANRDAPEFDVLGGKVSVYEGGIRVPLVVTGPPVTAPGSAHDGLVHFVDVLPTVAALIEGTPDPDPIDGRSLLPFVEEPAQPGDRTELFTEFYGPAVPPFNVDRRVMIGPSLKLVDNVHDATQWITRLGPSPADEVQIEPAELTDAEAQELDRLEARLADQMATF